MTKHGRNLIVDHVGDVITLAFARADLIDSEYLDVAEREILDLVHDAETPRLVIDFEQVRFLSSAAMRLLVTIRNEVHAKHGALHLANVDGEVLAVFELVKLMELIPTHATLRKAIRACEG